MKYPKKFMKMFEEAYSDNEFILTMVKDAIEKNAHPSYVDRYLQDGCDSQLLDADYVLSHSHEECVALAKKIKLQWKVSKMWDEIAYNKENVR